MLLDQFEPVLRNGFLQNLSWQHADVDTDGLADCIWRRVPRLSFSAASNKSPHLTRPTGDLPAHPDSTSAVARPPRGDPMILLAH